MKPSLIRRGSTHSHGPSHVGWSEALNELPCKCCVQISLPKEGYCVDCRSVILFYFSFAQWHCWVRAPWRTMHLSPPWLLPWLLQICGHRHVSAIMRQDQRYRARAFWILSCTGGTAWNMHLFRGSWQTAMRGGLPALNLQVHFSSISGELESGRKCQTDMLMSEEIPNPSDGTMDSDVRGLQLSWNSNHGLYTIHRSNTKRSWCCN